MVFQSLVNLVRARGPDEFWRKRRIFKLSAVREIFSITFNIYFKTKIFVFLVQIYSQHYYGRRRNCYSIAIRGVHRALVYATKARQLKKDDMKEVMTFVQSKRNSQRAGDRI